MALINSDVKHNVLQFFDNTKVLALLRVALGCVLILALVLKFMWLYNYL
jgi:hypothetical protein